MSKRFLFLIVMACLVVCGLIFVACDNGTTGGSGDGAPDSLPSNWKTMSLNSWYNWYNDMISNNAKDEFTQCAKFIWDHFDEIPEGAQGFWGPFVGINKLPFLVSGDILTINVFLRGDGSRLWVPTDPDCDQWKLQNDSNKGTFPVGKWINQPYDYEYILFTHTTVTVRGYPQVYDGKNDLIGTYSITGNTMLITYEIDWDNYWDSL